MDGFGFGIEDKSPAQRQNEIMVKDHINVWNRLVENKSPIGVQQDDLNWKPRFEQLMGDDSFRNFLKSDTVKDKITILRDSGLGPNKEMSDQDLAQFLMTHAPTGLTEDPNMSEQAKENVESKGSIGMGVFGAAVGAAGAAALGFPGAAIPAAIGAGIGSYQRSKMKDMKEII